MGSQKMPAPRVFLGAVLLFVAGPLSPLFARTSDSHCWCGPGGCYAGPTSVLPGTGPVSWARGRDHPPDAHLRLRGGGRRQIRSAKEADEHERDVTRLGGALVSPVPADLARDLRGRARGLQDLARSDSPCLIDDPLGIPRALRNDPDPSYLDGGIGGFSQYGDTEVGDKARAWETDFEQEARQNAVSDGGAAGRDGASGGTDQAKTIGDILDELGVGKPQKAKAEDGHAPEIAREMGLSDPSEDNPDANQVMDLVRFAQQHNRLSSWGGWTVEDTNRLYWGVRYFGSDFDTMQQALFRNRTRAEIKRKFSGEEYI